MVTWGGVTTFASPGGNAATSTPAAAAAGGFNFGGAAAPNPLTPGTPAAAPLFGTPGAKPGGFSFGASPAAAAPAAAATGFTGSSLFGGPALGKSPAPSLFGTPGTPSAATPGFGFSSPTPVAATPSFGMPARPVISALPSISAAPQQAAMHALLQTHQQQETARIEQKLLLFKSAYDTTTVPSPLQPNSANPNSHFQHIFYDSNPAQQTPYRPPNVSPSKWTEALAKNPDPAALFPTCILGADALSTRIANQNQKSLLLQQYLKQLTDAVEQLNKSAQSSTNSILYLRSRHVNLEKKMMGIMRKVEVLRCLNISIQPAEREWMGKIDLVWKSLQELSTKMREVEEMARVHQTQEKNKQHFGHRENRVLTDEEKQSLYKVLVEQRQGLTTLTLIAKKDIRDVVIIKKKIQEMGRVVDAPPMAQLGFYGQRR